MGKPAGKKKIQVTESKPADPNVKPSKTLERNSKSFNEGTAVFINMSQELKEEGNKLFQKRDNEGAMLKYEKALKLLPANHMDVAYLRSNMAACYMELGIGKYPRAIDECNLALQVAPKYSKALLKRARCYEVLDRLDLALRDVNNVLSMEPNNLTALEIADRVKMAIVKKGLQVEDQEIDFPPTYEVPTYSPVSRKAVKEKTNKRRSNKFDRKSVKQSKEKKANENKEKSAVDKEVVEEKRSVKEKKVLMKSVKLVHGEDIRWAQLPVNCSIRTVRDIVINRFPSLMGVLIKYKDEEGDLVTITMSDELRIAEGLADPRGFLRLYISEISPDKEPLYEGKSIEAEVQRREKPVIVIENNVVEKGPVCVEDWVIQFARLFKNHVGFESDSCLDIHGIGMKIYSEAMEDVVTGEDAQGLFEIAAANFEEMGALALFNLGNVHLSKARKRMFLSEDNSSESMSTQIKTAYEWAQNEYVQAGMRYEESLKIKPNFYEGLFALGQQQFEQAKLSWYYVINSKADLGVSSTAQILELYNNAEDNMEKGMQIWEEMEEQRLNGLSNYEEDKTKIQKFGLDGRFNDISVNEAAHKADNLRSQIYLLWGTMLYERSVVEYKLNLPTWEECLEVAVEKFELAGASQTNISVMIKKHCSNEAALDGFKVDEIVQAWNEMYGADGWRTGVTSLRLEPLFRRRSPKLRSMLELL